MKVQARGVQLDSNCNSQGLLYADVQSPRFLLLLPVKAMASSAASAESLLAAT
jgi:hypothetical protein